MCLMYLFHKFEIDALVVHINYGKRGEESDKDAELVEEMAFQWGFNCQTIEADTSETEGENFQRWARDFRYDVFRSLAKEHGATGIATAHHQDDQVETILQKQFRGAGLESWSAMQVWDGELFRPLLEVSKEEIEDYCDEQAIPFRTDETNLENNFARNFLRNEWFAELENHFPGWKKNVLRISDQAQLFEQSLEWISNKLTDDKDRIDRGELLELDPDLTKSLVLHKLKKLSPGIEISRDALQQLDDLKSLQTGKQVQLSTPYYLMRDRDHFKIVVDESQEMEILTIKLDDLADKPFGYNGLAFCIEEYENPDFENGLYLDISKIDEPITIRYWKHGDRFQPFGMEGHQSVADHLTNEKISAAEKHRALVIESFEETICAIIFPPIENRVPPGTISEQVKCDAATQQCLTIKRT